MSSTYYQLYEKDVLDLAKSLVIKSVASAEAINTYFKQLGLSVDDTAPQTWKYYLNLAGEYHRQDTLMRIVSLDTQEMIDFTKANLDVHRATRKDYVYGSTYYNELLRQYPDQEELIYGIVNPIDINTAINAPDNTILYYNPSLVEENEESLIPKLQTYVNGFFTRWVNKDYGLVDDLYAATMLGILFLQLPSAIMNLRLAACKTNEAHSFHIRQYLASHGKLDNYMDVLTKKQALFLYRNILYIQRNAGKASTFELLVDRLLTERGLPLAAYEMRHNLAEQPGNLYPDVELLRDRINLDYATTTVDVHTVDDVLTKEISAAKGNLANQGQALEDITEAMKTSRITHLPTKVLESDVVDLSDSAPFTLSDTLLNHWIYFSCTNRYPTVIGVNNPQTGERIQLTAHDALVTYFYCYNKSLGVVFEKVPNLVANRVRRTPLPTRADLRSVVDPKYVEERLITAALANQPAIGRYISTSAFYDVCVEIHAAAMTHRNLYALREHQVTRGQVEAMVGRCYQDVLCNLADEEHYDDWFKARGLNIPELSTLDQGLLAVSLLKEATGLNLSNSKSLKELQETMLKLMAQLSSYSVQYVATINSNAYLITDWAAIRVGDDHTFGFGHWLVNDVQSYVKRLDAFGHGRLPLSLDEIGVEYQASAKEHASYRLNTDMQYRMTSLGSLNIKGEFPNVHFNLEMPDTADFDLNVTDMDGLFYPPTLS